MKIMDFVISIFLLSHYIPQPCIYAVYKNITNEGSQIPQKRANIWNVTQGNWAEFHFNHRKLIRNTPPYIWKQIGTISSALKGKGDKYGVEGPIFNNIWNIMQQNWLGSNGPFLTIINL